MVETLCKFKYIFWSGWELSFKHETQSRNKTQQCLDYHKAWKNTSKDWRIAAVCPSGWRSPLYSCTCCKRSCRIDFVKRKQCTQSSTTSTRDVLKRQQTGHQPLGPWTALPRWDKSQGLGKDQGLGEDAALAGREPTLGKSFSIWAGFQYMHVILFFRV